MFVFALVCACFVIERSRTCWSALYTNDSVSFVCQVAPSVYCSVLCHVLCGSIRRCMGRRMFQVSCWWFVVLSSGFPSPGLFVYVPFSSRFWFLSVSPRLLRAPPLLALAAMSSESKKVVDELQLHKPRFRPKRHFWKVVEHQETKQRENRKWWEVPCRNGMDCQAERCQFLQHGTDFQWTVIAGFHNNNDAMQCVHIAECRSIASRP